MKNEKEPWVDLGPEIITHDKPVMLQADANGRLLCKCPSCEREHSVPIFGGSDLQQALDAIESVILFSPPDLASSLCPWCETWWKASRDSLPHARDCKAALLLRKHGRKVRFQGEP